MQRPKPERVEEIRSRISNIVMTALYYQQHIDSHAHVEKDIKELLAEVDALLDENYEGRKLLFSRLAEVTRERNQLKAEIADHIEARVDWAVKYDSLRAQLAQSEKKRETLSKLIKSYGFESYDEEDGK